MPKLLIVDDEPLTVEMLETFLQFNGYETVGALNGEDALTLLRLEEPALMILDLMLPDIEGYEICRRIRSEPDYTSYAGLPVLILSARIESASKTRAHEAGANAYLTKPVRMPDLIAELKRLLDRPHDVNVEALVPPPVETAPLAADIEPVITESAVSQPELTPTASAAPTAPEGSLILVSTATVVVESSGPNPTPTAQTTPEQTEPDPAPPTMPNE
ncbi:MAG: response regulator [Anaerolineae bacterium]|nr:response regulator [Anaerolineae bacterium]